MKVKVFKRFEEHAMHILKRKGFAFSIFPALLPSTDYESLFTHTQVGLTVKAMNRTGKQMQFAIEVYGKEHPDVKREIETRCA